MAELNGINPPWVVVVLDTHKDKAIPSILTPVKSHGDAMISLIKKECPGVTIERMGKMNETTQADQKRISNESKHFMETGSETEKLLFGQDTEHLALLISDFFGFNSFKELADSVEKGKKPDAVNLSMATEVKISNLAAVTKLPLTRENLKQYKKQVREWIRNSQLPKIKKLNEELENIERLTAKGIPIYVGAGNKGKNYVNLYSFADRVTTVGALEKNEKTKTPYTVDNSLVTIFEVGNLPIKDMMDKNSENSDERIYSSSNLLIPGTSNSTAITTGKKLFQLNPERCAVK